MTVIMSDAEASVLQGNYPVTGVEDATLLLGLKLFNRAIPHRTAEFADDIALEGLTSHHHPFRAKHLQYFTK